MILSDEEKKAIEECDRIFIRLDDMMSEESANDYRISYLTLTNLIEKQSKEIEELRTQIEEHVYNGCDYELCNKKWEDKIKAKIEKYKWAVESYDGDEADYKQSQAVGAWNVLQSLLEKE